jgi:FTR1 family protein
VLGFLLYWGGIRLNLGVFFKWTSLFILLVAAGLAAGAIRAFHEAGLWNHFQDVAFDLSNVLSTHSLTGTLLEGIFGIRRRRASVKWRCTLSIWFRRWCCSRCRRVPAPRRRILRRNGVGVVTTYF